MGVKSAASMLLGMVLNFVVIVPAMISMGEIPPRPDGTFTRVHVVNNWALWWGIVIMVVSLGAVFFPTAQPIPDPPPTPSATGTPDPAATATGMVGRRGRQCGRNPTQNR